MQEGTGPSAGYEYQPQAVPITPVFCGMAIASLVLGILAFCIPCIAAIIGLVLGIIALISIGKSNGRLKGTGLAVTGITLSAISLVVLPVLMAILMPALARTRDLAYTMLCATNMKGMANAMLAYQQDYNGNFPTSSRWCDLLTEKADVSRTTLWCKAHGDYEDSSCYAMNEYVESAGRNPPPDMVLLFETDPGWNQVGGPEMIGAVHRLRNAEGCNILFVDGRVEFVEKERFGSLRWTPDSSEP